MSNKSAKVTRLVLAKWALLVSALGFAGCGRSGAGEKVSVVQSHLEVVSGTFSNTNLKLAVSKNACATNVAQDYFNVANADTAAVPLSSISVKYWVNDTSGVAIVPHVWYGGCVTSGDGTCVHQVSGVTATATPFAACGPDPNQQANWEITVTTTDATALSPGFTWSGVQTAINRSDYGAFVPGSSTWYSGCASGQPYGPDPHFGVYVGGALVFSDGIAAPACRAPQGGQQLSGYAGGPADTANFPVVGPVPPDTLVALSIGLPVSDPVGLRDFIHQVSDPKSSTYRQGYLTPDTFKTRFGASDQDYDDLSQWAVAQGFTIAHTFSNNLLLSVTGTAAQVERAFFVNLIYRATTALSGLATANFVSVDREPSLNLATPTLLAVTGFTDWVISEPQQAVTCYATPNFGSPHGSGTCPGVTSRTPFNAADLRNAYLGVAPSSCQAYDGTGQVIGILSEEPLNIPDVAGFIAAQSTGINPNALLPTVTVGSPGVLSPPDILESTLDVDMVLAMAPNAQVVYFVGNAGTNPVPSGHADDLLHAMATDGRLTVVTNSYSFERSDNSAQALAQMAAEGISFFASSMDFGNVGDPHNSLDMDFQTLVGGTILQNDPSGNWVNETTWNNCGGGKKAAGKDVTGGGVMDGSPNQNDTNTPCICFPTVKCCPGVPIPDYQDPAVVTGANGGSPTWRNYPDVAAAAQNVENYSQGCMRTGGGTSSAAPIWAGFAALVNQAGAANGFGPLGFANPSLYLIGETAGSSNFHDIADGVANSATPGVPGFPAVTGYDLATGWGSPTCSLLTTLTTFNPTPPDAYPAVDVHIALGHDGLEDKTSLTLDLFNNTTGATQTITLKSEGEGGWSDIGNEHDVQRSLNPPLRPEDMGEVTIHMHENGQGGDNADNVDISGLDIRLVGSNVPTACIENMNFGDSCNPLISGCDGDNLEDGHPGVIRLSESAGSSGAGPDNTFVEGFGCGVWNRAGSTPVLTDLRLILDTDGDGEDPGSNLDLAVFDPNGVQLEHGQLQPNDGFGDQTERTLVYHLQTPGLTFTSIGQLQLTFSPHRNDEWRAQAISVYGYNSTPGANPGEETCLFIGHEIDSGTQEFRFNGGERTHVLQHGLNCPR